MRLVRESRTFNERRNGPLSWYETRVALTDSRALCSIRLHPAGHDPLPRLGPEATDAGFHADALHAALRTRRSAIKLALLDQAVVAGLGNIYAAEALWHARVDPRTQASRLSRARLRRIVDGARRALSLADPGRYQDGDGSDRFEVYDREGAPCRRCGKAIRRIVQGGRSTYFCGGCQT